MSPQSFLHLLWGNKPEHLFILVWTLRDKRSRWFHDIDEAAHAVEGCSGTDIYVGVGLSPEDFGPHQRCPAEKTASIAAMWADIDIQSDAHAKKALPATIADSLSIMPASMPPTIIVATGNGIHAWWLLEVPLVFDTDEERANTAGIVHRWQTMLQYNGANRGWALDRLADLSRILRVPGTYNFKDPTSPKPVLVHSLNDRKYNLSEFEGYLDDLGIPEPETQPVYIAPGSVEGVTGAGFVLNLNAEIPDELIRRWAETDTRFRSTWFRQRHDLKDQSQSGYDLALADFGADAGLTRQEIVNLIIHHRRLHGQKQRTRADYFQRTLARAANRADNSLRLSSRPAPTEDPSAGTRQGDGQTPPGHTPTEEAPVDPMVVKAVLCESISAALGIRILRLVKITGKDPTYQVELEHGRIELSNVSKLIGQKSLRLAIASAVNKIIPRIKPRDWERLAQVMLNALIEREGGIEAEFEGSMRVNLGHYLIETGFIPGIEGQASHAIRRPMVMGGQIAVNSVDLQLYLNKTLGQNLSVKAIASMLSAIGAQSIRVRGAKIREQGRWLLPVDEFNPTDFTAQGQLSPAAEESNVGSE
jgi:hypothetical protein